jgi:hypothetical protein
MKIGDDLRSAIITSNICVAKLHHGDFVSAVNFGERAVALAGRALSPRLVSVHLNLATALLMRGDKERALQSIEAAEMASRQERSWAATMEFLLGNASNSLIMGNVSGTLDLVERAERVAWGKERAVPNAGLFNKLRIHRAVHVGGPDHARPLVAECQAKYRNLHPFYYLDAVACGAWLDKLSFGHYTQESERDLNLFNKLGARGLWTILATQGFLDHRSQALAGVPRPSRASP